MIGVNRIGNDLYLEYPGHSSVINPMGEVLEKNLTESIAVVEIEKDEVENLRKKLPFLDDIKLLK